MRRAILALVVLTLTTGLPGPAAAQQAERGWIGIALEVRQEGDRSNRPSVVIEAVREGSPAAQAGLRPGDRLLAVNDLVDADDFWTLPERLRLRVGERVSVTIERDGRRREVSMRASERPADLSARALRLEAEAAVESMVRAMDSLRIQLIGLREARRPDGTSGTEIRLSARPGPDAPSDPFEFFPFPGEVIREAARLRATMSEAARQPTGFQDVRPGWSSPVPAQGREARRSPSDTDPESTRVFRPLTPYVLGNNMVAGAQVIDLRPELARYFGVDDGVLIVDVLPGTPAAIAGMVPGDVVVRLDQVAVRSVEQLRLGISRSGQSLPISLVRQGVTLETLLSR